MAVPPAEIFSAPTHIFAPCAMGGILNDTSIPLLKAEVIVGSANNQLLAPRHGEVLHEMGILYAPDYVANAGGMINGMRELLGWDVEAAFAKVQELYDTMLDLFRQSKADGVAPFRMADSIAEAKLAAAGTI